MASTSSPRARVSTTQRSNGRSSPSRLSLSSNGVSNLSVRPKVTPPGCSGSTSARRSLSPDLYLEPGRVRVAIRVRPRNAEELISDADFADSVELQPEMKRLKLKKNNWNADTYKFDEVFSDNASQRRVYEVVAKPVVESVLSGYNGTVMAYGQTGTGKTYTLGKLGKDDASERGIMVRAMEDIMATISSSSDSIEVSYLQLYLESIQDLLAPERTNIQIVEDSKTGEVTLPGALVVKIQEFNHFLQLLQTGESNRYAANTKMNTESSRSHSILLVQIRRSVQEKENDVSLHDINSERDSPIGRIVPTVRKSKLLLVDLAGSERLDKTGSKGHMVEEAKFINLSLTSLGKCINALSENSPHVPTRDSKLTRLLRDSFGGSARTSLIITIGPSSQHYSETSSTIMFGQRAMKVVNVAKVKEEFDYEGLCRNLENEVEHLNVEIDRQQKLRDTEKIGFERKLTECQNSFAETENHLVARTEFLEKKNTHLETEVEGMRAELGNLKLHNGFLQDEVARVENSLNKSEFLEKENTHLETEVEGMRVELDNLKDQNGFLQGEVARLEISLNKSQQCQQENSTHQKILEDTTQMYEKKITDMTKHLEEVTVHSIYAEKELDNMRVMLSNQEGLLQHYQEVSSSYQKALEDTTHMYEKKISELTQHLDDMHIRFEGVEEELETTKKCLVDHHLLKQNQEQVEIDELKLELSESHQLHKKAANEVELLKSEQVVLLTDKEILTEEISVLREKLSKEEKLRKSVEAEMHKLEKIVPKSDDSIKVSKSNVKENIRKPPLGSPKSNQLRGSTLSRRASISKYCEEVGLKKILKSLTSEDIHVQIHAVKVVANLAAEDINQEKIVEEGGLDALLALLQSSQSATVLRVASGAIANLAMNDSNQILIATKGGARLLANTASRIDDPQTLRMVAGAIANLCGNEKLHSMLSSDGATKTLLGMVGSRDNDVISQVARGLSNFAKCEFRGITQGHRKGRSKLIEDGALNWLIENSSKASSSSRRHIELALCHLAQNEANARDFINSRGMDELTRISIQSTREDIRSLAKKMLKQIPFYAEKKSKYFTA